jgi:hypothetical protein
MAAFAQLMPFEFRRHGGRRDAAHFSGTSKSSGKKSTAAADFLDRVAKF